MRFFLKLDVKTLIPWWLKVATKIILARLPVDYQVWNKMKLFRHGNIDDFWSPGKKFILHFNRAYPDGQPINFYCLELGPGDSVASGILANGVGASKTYLVDVGKYATEDIGYYKRFCKEMGRRNVPVPDISHLESFDELLEFCNIEYLTDGLDSLRKIQSNTIDFIWSHSVLEHVRKMSFSDVVSEFRRIIVDTGVMSHNADLKDHLGGALNNLRFSERVWESDFMANSGFYTNRLQHSDMLRYFENGEFSVSKDEVGRWEKLPTPVSSMDSAFQKVSENELRIRSCHMMMVPVLAAS